MYNGSTAVMDVSSQHPIDIDSMSGRGIHVVYWLYAHGSYVDWRNDPDCENVPLYVPQTYCGTTIVYIGVTSNLKRRLKDHSYKWWWPVISSIYLQEFATRSEANAVEIQDIRTERPALNILDQFQFRIEPDPIIRPAGWGCDKNGEPF